MPNINLTDSRKRDAVVKAENTGVDEEIRYVDEAGNNAYTRKILKATVEHDYDTLIRRYDDDPEKLALALVDSDPEVDMEKCGVFLWGVSKVFVNSDDGIVYRIEQTEVVRDPFGEVKEKRARKRSEANVDADIPLTWTGRQINKDEAARRFLFSSKLQIVHVNGLTYDFLYGMASELAKNNTLMVVGGGSKGRDPLIFRSGSIPYRGFLEGRIDGDKYILLLHLSNMELKLPPEKSAETKSAETKAEEAKPAEIKATETKDSAADKAGEKTIEKSAKKTEKPKKADAEPGNSKKKKSKPAKKTPDKNNNKEDSGNEKSSSETGKNKRQSETDKGTTTAQKKENQVTETRAVSDVVTSEDLGVWLKSIRMGKYLQLFVDNEIDVDVLPELTEDDLKELDIPVGSRRRLLKAVADTADLRADVMLTVKKMAKADTGKS